MKWVDTHCHLQLDERDPVSLLDRATEVDWVVVPGVDLESSEQAARLAADHPGRVLATVGLHPHDAGLWPEQGTQLTELAPAASAIGETGLDFYRNLSSRADQIRVFRRHVGLALELGKPIVVHCRDAFAEVIEVIEDTGVGPQTVMHCWTAGPKWTRRYLDLGVMFSFAGPVAFETGDTVRLGAALVPPDRALVETDTPYLAPPPHRGQPNEPAWVALVGAALAGVWGLEVEEVARVDLGQCGTGVSPPGGSTEPEDRAMTAQTRSEIAGLLSRHGLSPSRRLGQHFLADANITRKIVGVAGVGPGDQVVEIGAGTGTLTRALAASGAHVVAYEIDAGLLPVLDEVTRDLSVELRFLDITDADLAAELSGGQWVMVANLPYNVGTPLVLEALRRVPQIERFVVMVQREVAERLVSGPGSKQYGLPSVVTGIHAVGRLAFTVPAQVFYPPPRVESAVVVLDRVPEPEGADRAIEIAAAGFNQRRKMLRGALAGVFADPVATLERVGIDPTARAEDLSPADYLALARA